MIVPLWKDRIRVGITDRAQSGVLHVRAIPVAGHNAMDITISSNHLWQRTELSASVYNVWNSRIAVPGAEEHIQQSIPQYGRTWRIRVARTF